MLQRETVREIHHFGVSVEPLWTWGCLARSTIGVLRRHQHYLVCYRNTKKWLQKKGFKLTSDKKIQTDPQKYTTLNGTKQENLHEKSELTLNACGLYNTVLQNEMKREQRNSPFRRDAILGEDLVGVVAVVTNCCRPVTRDAWWVNKIWIHEAPLWSHFHSPALPAWPPLKHNTIIITY